MSKVELSGHAAASAEVSGKLTVVQASRAKTEESPTPRYLNLPSGVFKCYSRIWLFVDGERGADGVWFDITQCHPPDGYDE